MSTGVRPGRLTVLVAAVAVSVIMCALWTGAASGASSNASSGLLELCKAADNGAAGQQFDFTATMGGNVLHISVTGGQCSSPVAAQSGNWVIVEDLSSGLWQLQGATAVPASSLLSVTPRAGKVKVSVATAVETQVTFVNKPAGATVKVCKWSSSPALQGSQYSFTVNGQTVTATAGKNAGERGLLGRARNAAGHEAQGPGERARRARRSRARRSTARPSPVPAGLVKVTAAAGANIVTYENEPVGPPQTGYLEVCKDAGDDYVATRRRRSRSRSPTGRTSRSP